MKDVTIPDDFLHRGGAEVAPMSTSSSLEVALKYALKGDKSVTLFRIVTKMFKDRGVDISWLSCFPEEEEYLYPPITFLMPPKDKKEKPKKPLKFVFKGRGFVILNVEKK